MNQYHGSDHHLGHRTISRWRPFESWEHHSLFMVLSLLVICESKNTLRLNGDFVFTKPFIAVAHAILQCFSKVTYCPGNHCFERVEHHQHTYLALKNVKLQPLYKSNGCWYSHAPITERQLRGAYNIHGHTHGENEPHASYINICMESEFMAYRHRTKEEIEKCIGFRRSDKFDLAKHIPCHDNQGETLDYLFYQLDMIYSDSLVQKIYEYSLMNWRTADNIYAKIVGKDRDAVLQVANKYRNFFNKEYTSAVTIETAKQIIQTEYVKRQAKEQANVDTGNVLPDQESVPQSDQSSAPDV